MATKTRTRSTKAQMQALFDAATAHVESVPYKVTLRWLFYRLLQDGYYTGKGDYDNKLIPRASDWRHGGRWAPDMLVDEGREAHGSPGGDRWTSSQILETFMSDLPIYLERSHFYSQENYIELWFEANGMLGQFQHFTDGIRLVPFGGDPSIPFKYEVAQKLAHSIRYFGKPATVLYFGDRDKHGEDMYYTAIDGPKGNRKWCSEDFDTEWCGLSLDQCGDVPENPEKPGDYQWEALTDQQAGDIITEAVSRYIDVDLVTKAATEAEEMADELEEKLRPVIEEALEDE